MKATLQRRLTLLVGLLLLSLLVVAIGVQAAQAALISGAGVGGGSAAVTPPAGTEVGRGGFGLAQASDTTRVVTPPAGTEVGRGGFGLAQGSDTTAAVAPPTTSGASSATYWLIGSVVVVLIAGIGAWALLRRRRQPAESASAAYCALHPGDSLCGAA